VFSDDGMVALSSDALAAVDWLALLTLSEDARVAVRAFNAAVVMEGDITSVAVRTISSVPEPSTLTLLCIGLLGGATFRKRFK